MSTLKERCLIGFGTLFLLILLGCWCFVVVHFITKYW